MGGAPFTYTGGGLYVAYEWGPYAGTLSTTTVVWCNSTGLLNGLAGNNTGVDALRRQQLPSRDPPDLERPERCCRRPHLLLG